MKPPPTKRALRDLTRSVAAFVARMDNEMERPNSTERGGRISQLVNELDMANDRALHFGLDMSFPAIRKLKQSIGGGE